MLFVCVSFGLFLGLYFPLRSVFDDYVKVPCIPVHMYTYDLYISKLRSQTTLRSHRNTHSGKIHTEYSKPISGEWERERQRGRVREENDARSSKCSTRVLIQTFCLFVCCVAYSVVFPFFPFLSSCIYSIVFTLLFGEPSNNSIKFT